MRLQLTLAIIKPDLYSRLQATKIVRSEIINNGLYIVKCKELNLSLIDAKRFYQEHQGKFFYNRLVTYISSAPMCPLILAGKDAIQTWRQSLGPTKSYIARMTAPDTIRGRYGLTDTRNSVHGADSVVSVSRELKILFPEFNKEAWFDNDEIHFRNGNIRYCDKMCCHVVK